MVYQGFTLKIKNILPLQDQKYFDVACDDDDERNEKYLTVKNHD